MSYLKAVMKWCNLMNFEMEAGYDRIIGQGQ